MANKFCYSKTVFSLIAQEDMIFPLVKTSMLRGSFGCVFKKFNCANRRAKSCEGCLLKETCLYSYIFEGKTNSQTTKPYVIDTQNDKRREIKKGETFSFSLTLFGRAIEYLPHFIFAFIEIGKLGITKKKYKFDLVEVKDSKGNIVFQNNKIIASSSKEDWELMPQNNSETTSLIELDFITPLRLTNYGDLVTDVSFEHIIKALTRRITNLSKEHCGYDVKIDYKFLIEEAKNIKKVKNELVWQDWTRYSSRQHSFMEFGGLVGKVVFEGNLGPFMQYLQIGEAIHIGKNCVFGNGKYNIKN